MTPRLSPLFPMLALSLCVQSAFAQQAPQAPTAGNLLRELQNQRPLAPIADAPAIPAAPAAPARSGAEPAVAVKLSQVKIEGASVYSEAELKALVQDAVGRELGLSGLEELTDRITRHYRQNGYTVARAYLPAQDIKDGALTIAVIEGRLGQVEVLDPSNALKGARPLSALTRGAPVTDKSLERSLLLLRDLPGIEAQSTLRPGASVGSSDLAIEISRGDRFDGSAQLDNHGSLSTGRERLNLSTSVNNPLDIGDQLSLSALSTGKLLNYLRLGYQAPVGSFGTRAGASASALRYRLGGEFSALEAKGTAYSSSAFLSHPLLRSRAANLNAMLAFENKRLSDRIDSVEVVTDKSARSLTLTLSGDLRDSLGGGGVSALSAAYSRGKLDIETPDALLIDQASARSNGSFGKLTLSALRLQSLGAATTLYVSYSGQLASKNLDSSEKFSLGGAQGVRAYPQGEAPADRAHLVTAELRHALTDHWQVVGFVDAARAKINQDPWPLAPGAVAAPNERSLSGAGLGVNWSKNGYSARAYYAHRLGSSISTAESDRKGRVWAQLSKQF